MAKHTLKGKHVKAGGYHYIKKEGDEWVVVRKGTGQVISRHKTKEKAIESFRAMEASKHGEHMRNG